MATSVNTKGFKLSLANKTLTITKEFEENYINGNAAECNIIARFRNEIPGLRIVRKTHSTPKVYKNKDGSKTSRNQFKNLTYEHIERFLNAIPNNEEYLNEYTFARYGASDLQINAYTLIRKWFVAQFPEYRKNPMFYLYNHPDVISFKSIQKQDEAEKAAAAHNEEAAA